MLALFFVIFVSSNFFNRHNMKDDFPFKPANQNELDFYCRIGEAVCAIQIMEDALSATITVKKHSEATKAEFDEAYNKEYSRYTLGKAVRLAEKEQLLPVPLQNELNDFYHRRNWLVHTAIVDYLKGLMTDADRKVLFQKVKEIANDAQRLQRKIEIDLMDFAESKGRDMSKVRAAIAEHEKRS